MGRPKPIEEFVNCLKMLSSGIWQTTMREEKILIHSGIMSDERASSHHSGDWLMAIQPNLDASGIKYEHRTELCNMDGAVLSLKEAAKLTESSTYFVQSGLIIDPAQDGFAESLKDFLSKSCTRMLERIELNFPSTAFNNALASFLEDKDTQQER